MGAPPHKKKRQSRAAAARAFTVTTELVMKQVANLNSEGAMDDLSDLSEDE